MKNPSRSALKKILLSCLKESGSIIRKGFGTRFSIRAKGPVNIVTEIDMASERKIVGLIRKSFPDHRILTEESQPITSASPYRWIIDPLDGTTNFAHRLPLCCVSIAVEFNEKVILGGIYNPFMGELFFAESGKGAFLNGKRIRVSKMKDLLSSLLVTGFPYDRREKAAYYLKFFQGMMEKSQGLRRLGAAALDLAYVANGQFEAFWELNLKPWDIAAGILLVEEAGGKVSDFQGKPLNVNEPRQLLTSNGQVHSQIISVFKKLT